jgi:hypothetical protein
MKTYDTISGRFLLDPRDAWESLWSARCSLPDSAAEESPSGLCICSKSCICSGEYLLVAAIPEIGIVDSEIASWPIRTASGVLASTIFEEKYCRWRNRHRKIKRPHGDSKRSCHLQQSSSIAELPVVRKARGCSRPHRFGPIMAPCNRPFPRFLGAPD